MKKWFRSSDAAGIGMWVAYFVAIMCFLYAAQALAGGMEPGMTGGGPEQNIIAQKIIEVTTVVPEDDWKDYLEWIVPGVITPIILFYAGYKINKRRK